MSQPEYLVFIESNPTTGRLFAQRARYYGCVPIVLTKSLERLPFLAIDEIAAREIDTMSFEAIRAELQRICTEGVVRGIGTSTDLGVVEASILAQSMGLPGPNPDVIRLGRDKAAQRALLRSHGEDNVQQHVCFTEHDCERAAHQIGDPVVVKPIASTGSIGARHCESPAEAREHAKFLLGLSMYVRRREEFLVERAIEGPQYSLEIFNGRLISIVRQHYGPLPFFVARGHDFPAQIGDDDRAQLERFAEMIIDLFRLSWGPFHIEVRMDIRAGKVALIEVNPRLVGAYVPELIRHTCGIDLIDMTIRNYLGLPVETRHRTGCAGVMRFMIVESESVFALPEDHAAEYGAAIKEIKLYIDPGAHLTKANDFRDRYGHVIAVAETYEKALASADRVVGHYADTSTQELV